MNTITATYSPEDNKLRFYSVSWLDSELNDLAYKHGFRRAPKQGLWVAPKWTPEREDFLLTLVDEIDDEDRTLAERAEYRAERFSGYNERREADGDRAYQISNEIGQRFEFGQPILVGGHSEKGAGRDAERVETHMRNAIKNWQTAEYWQKRAERVKRHASRKHRPDVSYRRIKTLSAELRGHQRTVDTARKNVALWQRESLTVEKAIALINFGCVPYGISIKVENDPSEYTLWSALAFKLISLENAVQLVIEKSSLCIPTEERWIAHLTHRITYEKAMIEENGGLASASHNYEIGGKVKTWRGWSFIKKINKVDGVVNSLSTAGRGRGSIPIDEVTDYEAPKPGIAEKIKEVCRLPPLCNYPGEGFEHITKEKWQAHKMSDVPQTIVVKAYGTHAEHRTRATYGGSFRTTCVYLVDSKRIDPPAL